jgi:hypothetical protein
MAVAVVRSPAEFETRLQRYLFERAEESRAVRVGEKEVSEQAQIVARYADLFSRPQHDSLEEAEAAAEGDERERLYRLRKTCESGIVLAELAEQADALENAQLAARVRFRDEELSLRTAQARLAVLRHYADREELGTRQADVSAQLNPDRLEFVRAAEALEVEISGEPDPVARSEEQKAISLRGLGEVLGRTAAEIDDAYAALRARWFDRLLGAERADVPSSHHMAFVRRLSPLESTYPKERAVEICLDTLARLGFVLDDEPNIRLDVEDRPQKSPRACVVPSDPPAVVHLITRAQGGLHDYGAFLHEAGHALHYAGSADPLPYTFRAVARDHALTEIYSYIIEAISYEPGWHERYFDLTPRQAAENAEAAGFAELLLFRRYEAKLRFELEFWSMFGRDGVGMPQRYSELLTAAAGVRYGPENYLADMDAGFYSADYLRAWIRSSQLGEYLRGQFGDDWWCDRRTGAFLRELWAEGTQPLSEEIAARLGFDPLDAGPLVRKRAG